MEQTDFEPSFQIIKAKRQPDGSLLILEARLLYVSVSAKQLKELLSHLAQEVAPRPTTAE